MEAGAANWVWVNSRAANGSLIVLLAIADESDKDGNAEMGVAELARKARLSERAVQGAMRDLTALGELQVVSEGGGRGRRYVLRVPVKGAESAGFNSERVQNLRGKKGAESAGFSSPEPSNPQVRRVKGAESAGFEISDMFISTTGSSLVDVKDVPAKPERPDANRLCEHLASRIEGNGSKRPAITAKWRDAARLMLDKDGRTEQQVMTAIDWCQDNEFWRGNILSMPKLREKYEQLRLQASRDRKTSAPGRRNPDDDYTAALKRINERREAANGTRGNSHNRAASQIGLPAAADRPHNLRHLAPRSRRA